MFIRYKNDTQHPSSGGPLNSSRNLNPAARCDKSVQPTKEDALLGLLILKKMPSVIFENFEFFVDPVQYARKSED
jgi:hypothetical protein